MKNMKVTVSKKGYDALAPISEFNNIAGNTCEQRSIDETLPQLYLNLIDEEYIELSDAVEQNNLQEILDGASDLIVVAAGLLHTLGFDPNQVMQVINESNMSKYCSDEQEAKRSVQQYDGDSRYKNVHYKYQSEFDKWVVYGEKVDGKGLKILKSWKYKDAAQGLRELIEQSKTE